MTTPRCPEGLDLLYGPSVEIQVGTPHAGFSVGVDRMCGCED